MKFEAVKENQNQNNWETFKVLSKYLWVKGRPDLKFKVVLTVCFLIIGKGANVLVPYLYKKSVDSLSTLEVVLSIPFFIIFSYGLARILNHVFSELRDYYFAYVTQYARRKIAHETFDHLHELSLSFHLDRQMGGLSRVIERGTNGIQFVLNFLIFNIFPTLFEIALVTAILAWKFPPIFSILILATIVIYVVYSLMATEWRMKFRVEMNETESLANTKAIDSLINYETVKYFGNEAHESQSFDQTLAKFETSALKSQSTLSILNLGQGTIIGVGLMLIMMYAARGVLNHTMTVGDFVLVNTYLIQLYSPLHFLGFVYREIKQGLIGMDKMFELLNVQSDVKDVPNAPPLECKSAVLEFKNVTFGYNADRGILNNISFRVESGKKVAVVGPSGSGKSTLARLLFRFYEPESGEILIDGQNILKVTQHSLRKNIGIVPQDTVLFNESIQYNVQYGNMNASHEELIEASKHAEIHAFIESLPKQYQTVVGERGLKLSGGEKQRVAIARTILKNPKILVFDEATSALDSHTEKKIQASLKKVSSGKTTLIIAHRLSTIVDADEILVLKQGEIVERGTHAQLITQNQEYKKMWDRQQQQLETEVQNKSDLQKAS